MLTVALPVSLENAVLAAAQRHGQSVDDYVAETCAAALMLEEDRSRVAAWRAGTLAIPHDKVDAWLADLEQGRDTPCPR